jgi:heme/copper-type cytochrome/quinol oxidase subunit 2
VADLADGMSSELSSEENNLWIIIVAIIAAIVVLLILVVLIALVVRYNRLKSSRDQQPGESATLELGVFKLFTH